MAETNENDELYFHPNIQDKFGLKGVLHFHNSASILALLLQAFVLISAFLILLGSFVLTITCIMITIHHFIFDRNPSAVPNNVQNTITVSDLELELSSDGEDVVHYIHKARNPYGHQKKVNKKPSLLHVDKKRKKDRGNGEKHDSGTNKQKLNWVRKYKQAFHTKAKNYKRTHI